MKKLKLYLVTQFGIIFITWKWRLFGFYYRGLAIQAQYLYRQSDLYKCRWQELGMDFADKMFKGSEIDYFFWLAQKEPLTIKGRIFLDGLLGYERKAYYLGKEI